MDLLELSPILITEGQVIEEIIYGLQPQAF
jgi:hypothetical protein